MKQNNNMVPMNKDRAKKQKNTTYKILTPKVFKKIYKQKGNHLPSILVANASITFWVWHVQYCFQGDLGILYIVRFNGFSLE